MNSAFFKPWVGTSYFKGGYSGKKLLILGESHYCQIEQVCDDCGIIGRPGCTEFTINTVGKYLDYKRTGSGHEYWMNTFTKFGNVLENQTLDSEATTELWHSMALYNYVQIAVADKRMAPPGANFAASSEAFIQLLAELKPDLVISWGMRLWNNLPTTGKQLVLEDTNYYVYTAANGMSVPVIATFHPSTGRFNYGAHGRLAKAIHNCQKAAQSI